MRRALPALCLGGGAAAAEIAAGVVPGRPQVARALIDELFLGVDPLAAIPEDGTGHLWAEMTHVAAADIDMVLHDAAQPVSFWLELGSYEGGSAILTARRVQARAAAAAAADAPKTSIVAVDTFLGDFGCLWNKTPDHRRQMLRSDGTMVFYERFRQNVRNAGQGLLPLLLPLPATTLSALRLFKELANRRVAPKPQVIYLDSAHEKGEVWLELQLAWQVLAPGGVLFGDDWAFYDVQSDVLLFAASHKNEVDDGFGHRVQPMRTLGRVRAGLFVSYPTFQWFIKKLGGRWIANRTGGDDELPAYKDAQRVGYECWTDGFNQTDCCDTNQYGPAGNWKCWDLVFTYSRCC